MSDLAEKHFGVMLSDRSKDGRLLTLQCPSPIQGRTRWSVTGYFRTQTYPSKDIALLGYQQELRLLIYYFDASE
jgi:hypothetical protein